MKLKTVAFALLLVVPLLGASVHAKNAERGGTSPNGALSVASMETFGFYCSGGACEASGPAGAVFVWSGTGTGANYPRICGTEDVRCDFQCTGGGEEYLGVTVYSSTGALIGSASQKVCDYSSSPEVPF